VEPAAPAEVEPAVTLDKLIGTWTIHQLEKGHRFSTDDLVTAWRAARAAPGARRLLDLGCGIGSVGLSTLYQLPGATLVGVEAQEVSTGLFRRTVQHLGLQDRVTVVHGDLRDPDVLPAGSSFELVTGSPPYVPVGHGLLSKNSQRAHARIELRGGVFDYCAAARRWMAEGARFAFVMAAQDPPHRGRPAGPRPRGGRALGLRVRPPPRAPHRHARLRPPRGRGGRAPGQRPPRDPRPPTASGRTSTRRSARRWASPTGPARPRYRSIHERRPPAGGVVVVRGASAPAGCRAVIAWWSSGTPIPARCGRSPRTTSSTCTRWGASRSSTPRFTRSW
jgi:tRNA1(Val) A37 N6-methylase TrmN6